MEFGITCIDFTIKCRFNTSQIDLTNGGMSGQSSNGNQTRPHNFNITCTAGTSVSLKLSGIGAISGKTDNYTRCGSGGMCELTFDGGKYDETITIDNSKQVSIQSTYHLNDIKKPVAEYLTNAELENICSVALKQSPVKYSLNDAKSVKLSVCHSHQHKIAVLC